MAKIVRLTESELNRLVKKIVSEQVSAPTGQHWSGGYGPGLGQDKVKKVASTVTLDGSLFANGVDKTDTSSQAFQKGVQAIKSAPIDDLTVTVIGGASAVGTKQGYNNEDLARRRAENFVKAIKPSFPGINFVVKTKVGTATTAGDQANAEQFVKLVFTTTTTSVTMAKAIDHTAVNMNIAAEKLKQIPKPPQNPKKIRVCYDIPEFMYNIIAPAYKQYEVK